MTKNKFMKFKHFLFWGGLGFALSSILGLDGFKDTLQLPQLIIGISAIIVAILLDLGITTRVK